MADLLLGSEFAGCRIEAVAGRGGMGVIYRATDLRLGRPVAVKLLATDRAGDASFRERFEREARLTASLDHPNVIPVYAAGEEDGRLYLVMRYVGGTDLAELLREEGRLEPARAARIIAQVGSALDAAHAAGLVHRDIKPANVLIDGDGHVYLSDFGITRVVDSRTRATSSGAWVGTVDFMAPEHLRGEPADARSDVYALGCVLYTALAGTPPFRRETVPQIITAHLHDTPPLASRTAGVPPAFDAVIARALAKRPDERHPSAGDLARAAVAAAAGAPVGTTTERSVARGPAAPTRVMPRRADAAPTTPVAEPLRVNPPRSRRRRAALVAVALPLTVGIAAIVVGLTRSSAGPSTGPVTAADTQDAVLAFARAYRSESPSALVRVLAGRVQRVAPGDRQRGRSAVVAEYSSQFRSYSVRDYRLSQLTTAGGAVGRASARYEVVRANGSPITGSIVFGVVRDGHRPQIALIAAEPRT